MPMFEYKCGECGTVSEFLVGVTTSEPDIVCASCGSAEMSKMISTVAVNLRGSRERFPIAGQCQCGEGEGCAGGSCACMS